MKACVDAGRLRDADRLLQGMAAAGCPPDVRAYNILLAGHSRAANPVAMGRLLQRMQSAGLAPSAVTWNTLVDGYVRARDLDAAKRCTAQATAAGVALDVWTYSTLIKGYVQVGRGRVGQLSPMRTARLMACRPCSSTWGVQACQQVALSRPALLLLHTHTHMHTISH